MIVGGYSFNPVGAHGNNGTLSAAVALTPPTGANVLLIQPLTQNVRYTLDGTTPTNTTGFKLVANTIAEISVGPGASVKVIEETSGATIQYQWAVQLAVPGNRAART